MIIAKVSLDGMSLLCCKLSLLHSIDYPIVVEDNDIRTGEACAPIRATSIESEIGTALLPF